MNRKAPNSFRKTARGQSLVEFAFVSVFLILLLMGIIEMGRLLFAFSVVSNAAQEGTRYAITRPRDYVNQSAAATRIAAGTAIPTQLVVPDGSCNIYDNARQEVWGLPPSEVSLNVNYETASGTSVAIKDINNSPNSSNYYKTVIRTGNRVVVEANYKFNFIVPLISQFAPNGIDIKMSAARSILNDGEGALNCTVDYVPVVLPTDTSTPTRTPSPTNTLTNANATSTAVAAAATSNANATSTAAAKTSIAGTNATNTAVAATALANSNATSTAAAKTSIASTNATNTAVAANATNTSVAATATANALITNTLRIASFDVYKLDGNNKDLDVVVWLVDQNGQYVTNANFVWISATSSVGQSDSTFLTNMGNGSYRICNWPKFSGGAGAVTVDAYARKTGYPDATASTTNKTGSYCSVTPTTTSTPTRTSTPTSTVAATNTSTSTPTTNASITPTQTGTPTNTSTPTEPPTLTPFPSSTPTPVACPYTVTITAYKASGNQRPYVRVQVTDALGK
ncbi:MAG: pilus assembly protein, partial [Chloroflexota bacterium]|nr:pilus assembly protein [Chloroflexota bacterium]